MSLGIQKCYKLYGLESHTICMSLKLWSCTCFRFVWILSYAVVRVLGKDTPAAGTRPWEHSSRVDAPSPFWGTSIWSACCNNDISNSVGAAGGLRKWKRPLRYQYWRIAGITEHAVSRSTAIAQLAKVCNSSAGPWMRQTSIESISHWQNTQSQM